MACEVLELYLFSYYILHFKTFQINVYILELCSFCLCIVKSSKRLSNFHFVFSLLLILLWICLTLICHIFQFFFLFINSTIWDLEDLNSWPLVINTYFFIPVELYFCWCHFNCYSLNDTLKNETQKRKPLKNQNKMCLCVCILLISKYLLIWA